MKKIFVFLFFIFCVFNLFAYSGDFSITSDVAFYPKTTPMAKTKESWFAPITGFYSSLEARIIGKYNYVIPTPFGDNPLVSGNNLNFGVAVELSPVTVAPQFSLSFTPVAFLNFTASGRFGTGWDFIGNVGIGKFDEINRCFISLSPCGAMFYEFKFSSLFQFDLAAVLPGEWNHVVTLATYDIIYNGVTGSEFGNPFYWQAGGEHFNGWKYYSNIILGYQMPLILQTVGVQFEFSGYYNSLVVNPVFEKWNANFTKVSINPVAILQFNEKNALTIQISFSSRRGFSTEKGNEKTNFYLDYTGREWYFNRIALSYTMKL